MKVACPTAHSLRPGLLWLGGDDYLVCPNCHGSGEIELVEEVFVPVERTISAAGMTMQVPRHHPTFERLH